MPAVRLILGGSHARFLDTIDMNRLPEIGGRFALEHEGRALDLEVVAIEGAQSRGEPFAICRDRLEAQH